MAAHPYQGSDPSAQPTCNAASSQLSPFSTMDTSSRQQKRQDNTLSLLNAAIEAMNLAKELSSVTPAKAVFGTVGVLLTMIRVCYSSFSDILSRFQM